MPAKHPLFLSLSAEDDELLRKAAKESRSTVSGIVRKLLAVAIDQDPSLKLPLAQIHASEAKVEYESATAECERLKALVASGVPKTVSGEVTSSVDRGACWTNSRAPQTPGQTADRRPALTEHERWQTKLRHIVNPTGLQKEDLANVTRTVLEQARTNPDWVGSELGETKTKLLELMESRAVQKTHEPLSSQPQGASP